jgi:predicted nucleic acid-binding protein
MYLLDTMVLSELRKTRRDARLVAWLKRVPAVDLHLSVVTLGEVEKGIAKQQRHDPAFAERLARWLDLVLRQYGSRILAIDVAVARRWGRLADAHGDLGADLLIAATALEHGLTIVTRNLRHFQRTEASLLDPFAS